MTRGIENIFGFSCGAEAGTVGVAVRNETSFVGFLSKWRIDKCFHLRRGGHCEGAVRRVRSEGLLNEAVNDAARSFCIVANWRGSLRSGLALSRMLACSLNEAAGEAIAFSFGDGVKRAGWDSCFARGG